MLPKAAWLAGKRAFVEHTIYVPLMLKNNACLDFSCWQFIQQRSFIRCAVFITSR